ncbi:peptidoglycan-binding protein [Scytonema hofmannii FACHB-248]|uniref:Peptidoglycan-binding protein n=1 Tax=Scytonema hofmannii FACHB-248 TaxID=1842502 RepID=A0ABR8GZU3_9CYAN|nr:MULTISPECIES: peptidoglycan-binding protein [Nostocales]MBD2608525.1 peptidoglycan-binding protein [Scytonema hofmannii FACHB-248]
MNTHPNGVWIWNLSEIENNYLDRLVKCQVKRVYLKVFDGKSRPMFWSRQCSPEIIKEFKSRGMEVYGWGYHYGTDNIAEQVSAVKQALDCGLDGYILDLEKEVEEKSTHISVDKLLFALRPLLKEGTLGYTSFGHPGLHPNIPWEILDKYCDIALPQIYFEKFTFKPTTKEKVKDCLDAHQRIGLEKPILPIWGSESDTQKPATKAELQDYLNNYPGSSIWRLPNKGERGEAWNLTYSSSDLELPILTRYLRLGVEGEDVKALQRVLNAKGFNAGEVDGEFGSQTETAVKNFQKATGIDVDGEVGSQTWAALGGKFENKPPSDIRAKLADFAEQEAAKKLVWKGPNSEAEKYLKPFREPMQKLGHIGSEPVFYNWCAAFVTYCCRDVGIEIPIIPEGFWATMALVESWKFWAKKNGYWYLKGSITPQRGDIVVFDWQRNNSQLDHIGIVRRYTAGSSEIQTSEGNHSDDNITGNFTQNMANVAGFIRIG